MFLSVPAGLGCGPILRGRFRRRRNGVTVDSPMLRRLALARRKVALALAFKRAIDGVVSSPLSTAARALRKKVAASSTNQWSRPSIRKARRPYFS